MHDVRNVRIASGGPRRKHKRYRMGEALVMLALFPWYGMLWLLGEYTWREKDDSRRLRRYR